MPAPSPLHSATVPAAHIPAPSPLHSASATRNPAGGTRPEPTTNLEGAGLPWGFEFFGLDTPALPFTPAEQLPYYQLDHVHDPLHQDNNHRRPEGAEAQAYGWQPFGQDLVLGQVPDYEWENEEEELRSLQDALDRHDAIQEDEPRDPVVPFHDVPGHSS